MHTGIGDRGVTEGGDITGCAENEGTWWGKCYPVIMGDNIAPMSVIVPEKDQ